MTEGGEIEALVRSFAPPGLQATWTFCGAVMPTTPPSEIAGSPAWGALTAPVTGHAKIMARFESMIANLALSDFAILDLFVDGNKAAVRWRASVRHAETKDEFTTEIAQFLEVEHGQVISLVEFLDTAMARKLLGAK